MGHVKQNRMGGDLIECGVIHALFEDIPMSEVTCTSGGQSAFDAAQAFIKEMVESQCKLAGCHLAGQPYGVGDVHTEKCWFTKRAQFYRKQQAAAVQRHIDCPCWATGEYRRVEGCEHHPYDL